MAADSTNRNAALGDWMADHGVSAAELAERVNAAVLEATGKRGNVSERTVFRWRSGENRSPQAKLWSALEAVTGLSATELGFVPRNRRAEQTASATVHRRTFLAMAATTTIAATMQPAAAGARPKVGFEDVSRLRTQLTELWRQDDQFGGRMALEQRATGLAGRTLSLQQHGNASQKVRSRLYALAAASTGAAMFAALDGRRFTSAQAHLEKAITLAGLSGDGQVQHQAWRYAAMLAEQTGRYTDALAAAEACIATRAHSADYLFGSISHSRVALVAANLGDRRRALKALDRAADAFDRAEVDRPRPPSVAFYTRAETLGLAGMVHSRLGSHADAEFHAHQCLAGLRPEQHRNRAYYRAHLALAQLGQGDTDEAIATATTVPGQVAGHPAGRVSHLLGEFTAALNQRAPNSAQTLGWNDLAHTFRP